jgi:hypothetical protein
MATWFVDELVRRSPLWAGVSRAAAIDTVWALVDPALFWRLINARRWTDGRIPSGSLTASSDCSYPPTTGRPPL